MVLVTNRPVTVSVPSFLLSTVTMLPLALNVPALETLTDLLVNNLTPPKPPHCALQWSASPAEKSVSLLAFTALK